MQPRRHGPAKSAACDGGRAWGGRAHSGLRLSSPSGSVNFADACARSDRDAGTSGPRCSPASSPAWAAMSPRDGRRAVFPEEITATRTFLHQRRRGHSLLRSLRHALAAIERRSVRNCGPREPAGRIPSTLPQPTPGASR
jgi:hypothetical protein